MHVDVDGARLFFDTLGPQLALEPERMAERPTLIALHGGPGFDHSTMRPYFDRFADTHQVVYLDHRGNGRSTGDPDTWTLDQWGDDLAAFCRTLGIEKPVVFGQSFGGMVAMSYATRHPDGPGRLVLSSTAARMRLDLTYEMMGRLGGDEAARIAREFWTDPTPEGSDAYMTTCMPLYNPPGAASSDAARARAIMRRKVLFHFVAGEQRTMDFRAALARVACPTLVVGGGRDPITPPACAEEIAAALPPGLGRLEIFAGAGHGVYRDDPERGEALFRAFFSGGEA